MSRYPGSYADNRSRDPDAAVALGSGRSISDDIERLADVVSGGPTSMPTEIARAMIGRWAVLLGKWEDPQLGQVARSLKELSAAIGADHPEASRIGVLLTRLGMETRLVAADRLGPLGAALDRLACGLIFAGTSLSNDYQ